MIHIVRDGIRRLHGGRSMDVAESFAEFHSKTAVPLWSREGSRQAVRVRATSRRADRSIRPADGDSRRLLRCLCPAAPAPP